MIAHVLWLVALSSFAARQRAEAARARHEVRGPLCTAQQALAGLERSARVDAIGLELRRAARALDDLAGQSRREAVEVVDVGALLRSAVWQVDVVAAGPALVRADPLRIVQAVANLVVNAVEHGGGAARVRISCAGGRVRIEVTDRGPGLPAPLPVLLAAARGRRAPRGHGLAIAAAIARRYGGRLSAEPSPHGACLALTLPEAGTSRPGGRRGARSVVRRLRAGDLTARLVGPRLAARRFAGRRPAARPGGQS